MRGPLVIAVAQPLCVAYDVAANAATHAAAVRCAGARVVVFPELFLTGYELDAPAIGVLDPRLRPIVEACATDTAAVGIDVYVAGNLEFADEAFVLDERARRIAAEHQVWVAIASFAGSTGGGYAQAAGCSGIWTSGGITVAQAGPETGAIAHATLS